ncbi:unnamed protein product [Thlaspi arvense]|uniref:TIR domain-containing protein n=1 Tax=Thlaspi arvense TaxID=13288 RepID=A0AAU9RMH6_THLAR|nr:unnamed protein product [Thlaspi arvense]
MDRRVSPPPQHQVFINFRGDELRKNFISHLVEALQRSKINFFTDKQEQKGEDLSNLFKRIEESKIALAVFSKRYTESRWCLDELVKIKQRVDLGQLKVLPIFYNVTTDHVKLLNGEFGSNFEIHQSRLEQPKIDEWKEALACISWKIGFPFIDNNGFSSSTESEFIDSIVKKVLELLQAIPSVQTPNSLVNKLAERGEASSKTTKSSKKAFKAQKGNLTSPPNAATVGFTGSNSLAPQAFDSGTYITIHSAQAPTPANALRLSVPPAQDPYNPGIQLGHGSGFTGTRHSYDGYPIRYGNHESAGRVESSSMTNNSKKPLKPSKRNLEFTGTNGWIS